MKVLHINAGNEYGGGLHHIVSLLDEMKKTADVSLLVFEEGPVAKAARKKNISVDVLGQKSKFDIRFLTTLKMFILKNEFDLIHTHGPRANTYISRIIRKIRPVKWVITIHSNPELDFEGRGILGNFFTRLHVRTFQRADYVISVSKEIENIVQEHNVKARHSEVIHNGIPFREINGRTKGNDAFTLLSVGRLEKVKGHHILIDALSKVDFGNWKLILCGEGSQKENLQKLIKEKNMDKYIDFFGWVEKPDLDHYYACADVFILPSLSESFSLVALEAMEFHLPLIATKVGDVELMFPQGTEKFLVEKNDPVQLKKSIEHAYEMWIEGNLNLLSQKFYAHSKRFSINKQTEKTLSIYNQI